MKNCVSDKNILLHKKRKCQSDPNQAIRSGFCLQPLLPDISIQSRFETNSVNKLSLWLCQQKRLYYKTAQRCTCELLAMNSVTGFNGCQNPPIQNYRALVVAANVTASMMTPLAYSGRNTDPRKPWRIKSNYIYRNKLKE